MRDGLLHIHKRKRLHVKYQKYPHPDPKIRLLDKIIIVLAVLFPITAIPQLFKVWLNKNASDISLVTWTLFFIFSIPFLYYGIVHKEKTFIIMYSLWLIIDAGMVLGVLLYGP